MAIALAACSLTKPPPAQAHLDMPAQWMSTGGDASVSEAWWRGFNDPILVNLINEALTRNLDLREATARLAEARAVSDAEHGDLWPALNAGYELDRSRSINPGFGFPFRATDHAWEFQASYEVDLWGRVHALAAAGDATSMAARDAKDGVALSVAASIASSYITLRSLDAQLELARKTLASRGHSLEIQRARQQRGYGTALDTAQAEAEWRATAQVIPALELASRRQEFALDILLARTPGPIERGLPLLSFPLESLPDAGLPSELLRRRPDIASAEQQVVAADARFAAARGQLLPSVQLSATFGSVESTALLGSPFTIWSLGGSVLAPIFNGGRLRSLAQASSSRRDEALIGYERTVLNSLSEVETQLVSFADQKRQLEATEAERVAVAESLRIATRRFDEGYSSHLDELQAERALFNVDEAILQLHASLLISKVGLFRALGGGWTNDAPPALKMVESNARVSGNR